VRRALGAGGRHLAVLVVGDGLRLTGLGLLAGLLAFLAAAPALSALVQGVEPAGPSTFVAVALVMASVAVATALPTARRAARVDPVVTLREE
jgi:putative ABC transport system permease protein